MHCPRVPLNGFFFLFLPFLFLLLSALVRHSAARVIAAIAGIEMPVNGWPQLLPFLLETATSSQAVHRDVGIYILYTVLETIVEGFQEHLQSLFKLFENLLCDPESAEVRVTTARWAFLKRFLFLMLTLLQVPGYYRPIYRHR
jgi:hypothetical protein